METIFPREEKAEALFGEILKNPEACRRLMDTFNDSLDMADVLDAPAVSAQQFAAALFNAYENNCLLYTSPSPRDGLLSRMPSSA